MIIQEKIQKKAEGYGQLAPVFLEGAEFALENQWISFDRFSEGENVLYIGW